MVPSLLFALFFAICMIFNSLCHLLYKIMGSWITVVFPVNASITKSLAETAKDDQQLKIHYV